MTIELLVIYSNTWNHLIEYKKISSGLLKNVVKKICLQIIFDIYV